MASSLLDFDDPTLGQTRIVLTFRGVRTPLSRSRIIELLEAEQALLAGSGDLSAPPILAPVAHQESSSRLSRASLQILSEKKPRGWSVSHASLSGRIRKIYAAAAKLQRLRPAHEGLLNELLDGFCWQIPEHPNTRLDDQLAEVAAWKSTSEDLRDKIKEFLSRYAAARKASD